MGKLRTLLPAGVALSLLALGSPAMAGNATVTDPRNDTAMSRGGPDIVAMRISYGKRVLATLRYASAPESLGTISGVNIRFRNGRSYTLQRRAADPAFGTPLVNEIVGPTGRRVRCAGVTSSVNTARRAVTVSAPSRCFRSRNTKLRAQGFSFTRNFDTDGTRWTKWVAKQPSGKKQDNKKGKRGKKKKVTYTIVRLGESPITAVQTSDTRSGGAVRNTNAIAKFSGLRCVEGKCKGASVTVSASLKLQRRVNGSWSTVVSLPVAGKDTVVAPTLTRTFPNAAVIRYVWSGRATLGKERAPFSRTSNTLTVR